MYGIIKDLKSLSIAIFLLAAGYMELTNGYVYECRSIFINGCIFRLLRGRMCRKVTVRPLFDRTNLECIEMSSIGRVVIFYD